MVRTRTTVEKIIGGDKLESVVLKVMTAANVESAIDGSTETMAVSSVFVFIGAIPHTGNGPC